LGWSFECAAAPIQKVKLEPAQAEVKSLKVEASRAK